MIATFESRLGAILRRSATVLLKPLGFRKNGNSYVRSFPELQWLVHVERGQWNTKENSDFAVNVGVYSPEFFALYYPIAPPSVPQEIHCVIRIRLGMLAFEQLDTWWRLSESDEEAHSDLAITRDIAVRLQRDALPFLARFKSMKDVLDFFEQPRRPEDQFVLPMAEAYILCHAAVLRCLSAENKKAQVLFERALDAASSTAVRDVVLMLRKRAFSKHQYNS